MSARMSGLTWHICLLLICQLRSRPRRHFRITLAGLYRFSNVTSGMKVNHASGTFHWKGALALLLQLRVAAPGGGRAPYRHARAKLAVQARKQKCLQGWVYSAQTTAHVHCNHRPLTRLSSEACLTFQTNAIGITGKGS